MKEIKLPSGKTVLDLSSSDSTESTESLSSVEEDTGDMVSVSGALSLDVDDQCPKCRQTMATASACGETINWCLHCKVSMPKTL